MKTLFNFSGVDSLETLLRANDRFYYTLNEQKPYHFFNTALFFLENRDQKILEYQFNDAIGYVQLMRKWSEMEKTREFYPYIEIVSPDDPQSSIVEKKLNGIIRHIDDPFWDIYFPPNEINDRCSVIQRRNVIDTPLVNLPELNLEFRRNFNKPFIISMDKLPFAIPYTNENIKIVNSIFSREI